MCINCVDPRLGKEARPDKPKAHTKKKQARTDACTSGGNSFTFLEDQSHMLARVNLVIISREVCLDLLFMSVLELSSF